ncbi:sortase [Candidatus Saccharibacteria bacterium]|nr:sortase [Candidatus Saccharibacteria bacterium]
MPPTPKNNANSELSFDDLTSKPATPPPADSPNPTPAAPAQPDNNLAQIRAQLDSAYTTNQSNSQAQVPDAANPAQPVMPPPIPSEPPATPTLPPATEPIPVFRNPAGANMSAHPIEMGAPVPNPILENDRIDTPPVPPRNILLNLSPLHDSFAAHGLKDAASSEATTLLGKIALRLHLKTIFSPRNLRYAGVGLFSFLVFLLVFNFGTISTQISFWLKPPAPIAPIATPTPVVPADTKEQNQPETVDTADILLIPKINVNVPVVFEASIAEAAIQKALQNGVVHYAGTALPGERSNIVIVGHSSNDWWEPGNYKFAFALLEKLEPGDQIQFNYQKKKYVFSVNGKKVVAPNEISVLQPTTEPQLTLITCTPPGTSWKRLIITAKQIQPVPILPEDKKPVIADNQPKSEKPALPGNAPSILDQIKRFFGIGQSTNSTPQTTSPTATPETPKRNYLPEAA